MLIHRTVTEDEVYRQFLRSEIYRFNGHPARDQIAALVCKPDYKNIDQNIARHMFLFSERAPLFDKLPKPLEWHGATMELGDLEKLRFIRNCGWDDKAGGNVNVGNVEFPGRFDTCGRKSISEIVERVASLDFDKTLLLASQATSGPFTIIDGNHRAAAMMVAKRKGKFTESGLKAYLGVSPRMATCIWSRESNPT